MYIKTDINNLLFSELWLKYDKVIKLKLKAQSYRKECSVFKNHILPYFKDYLVKDIDYDTIVNWMSDIEFNSSYKYSTKSNIYTCMVSILNYAVKAHGLACNFASLVGNFSKNKRELTNIDFYTLEEFKEFIKVVDDKVYNILFNTLFFTGLRIGELTALTWNDFKNDSIDVNKTMSKEKDSFGNYIINSPKTPNSRRKIKIDNVLINSLNELKEIQMKQIDFNNDWYIFGGNKPFTQSTIGRRKNKYCLLAKLKKIRLHDFRHSHASLLLSQGVPITVISQRLGHSDISMTLNTYSHLNTKDVDKAIDIINHLKSNDQLFN